MKPSRRNRQVVRTWEVMQQLEQGPRSIAELAVSVGDEQGVTTRTIRRDIEVLEAVGFPLYSEKDEDDVIRWRLARNGVTPARRAA